MTGKNLILYKDLIHILDRALYRDPFTHHHLEWLMFVLDEYKLEWMGKLMGRYFRSRKKGLHYSLCMWLDYGHKGACISGKTGWTGKNLAYILYIYIYYIYILYIIYILLYIYIYIYSIYIYIHIQDVYLLYA